MDLIPPSGTLKIFDLASQLEREGKRIYHFEVGQPDFATPTNVVDAAIQALRRGETRYTPARGIPELLEAISEMYARRNLYVSANENVIVTPGAKMALFMGFLSTIDVNDDVLLVTPAWPTYHVMIRTAGGIPVEVPTDVYYTLDEEALKEAITRDCRCLVINSPNNPSGGVLSRDDLRLVHDLAVDYDFVVFSDEIYEMLVYDGFTQTSMLEIDPSLEHTLIINGFSKAYSMTGWRLGYAIGNPETINNMIRIQQNTTSCAASFVQWGGVEALTGNQDFINQMRAEYKRRRDLTTRLLCEMNGVSCVRPLGAFYVFPDFSQLGIPSKELAEMLLREVGVTAVPGVVFGREFDGHLRFSYATSPDVISEGLARMSAFLERFQPVPVRVVRRRS